MDSLRAKMKATRDEAGISLGRLALMTGRYSKSALAHVEAGRRAKDRSDIAEYVHAYDEALRTGGLLAEYMAALDEEDEVKRRALAFALSAIPGVAIDSRAHFGEVLRESILRALGGNDWADLAAEHGRRFMTSTPQQFQTALAGDLLNLSSVIDPHGPGHTLTAAARMMTLHAMGTANVGDRWNARRWYRNARFTADLSKDAKTRAWVRARAAFRGGYEGVDPADTLAEAHGIDGEVEGYLALAQAHARLGHPETAMKCLGMARKAHEGADHDETSIFGMPGWRMALSASYVHALLGNPESTMRELTAAPPPKLARWGAQHQMQTAVAISKAGDVITGTRLARDVMNALPESQRSIVLTQMYREAANSEYVTTRKV